jgi:butyrate kinase
MEECLNHYSEDGEVFKDLAREMHKVYEKLDSAVAHMRKKHSVADHDVDKLYRHLHTERADHLAKRAYGKA